MIFVSKHWEAAKLGLKRIMVKKFRSKLSASFSGIVHYVNVAQGERSSNTKFGK